MLLADLRAHRVNVLHGGARLYAPMALTGQSRRGNVRWHRFHVFWRRKSVIEGGGLARPSARARSRCGRA
jgi:hypothetical protein